MSEVGIKSFDEVVHLLHALSFDQITTIMDDQVVYEISISDYKRSSLLIFIFSYNCV